MPHKVMHMPPLGKGSCYLDISETSVNPNMGMFCHPGNAEQANPNSELGLTTFVDAIMVDQADRDPRWGEATERARTHVPVEYL